MALALGVLSRNDKHAKLSYHILCSRFKNQVNNLGHIKSPKARTEGAPVIDL